LAARQFRHGVGSRFGKMSGDPPLSAAQKNCFLNVVDSNIAGKVE
jgi:hypothetical protein